MNKQQLANKIWKSANQMRSKIEANEYKDFILGFMFYKYLSEKELAFFYLIRISIRFDKTNKVTTRSSKMRWHDKNSFRIDLSLSAVIVISEMIRIFAVHVA